MKTEIWYHVTSAESAQLIIANKYFKISPVKNGNFLGRGIYFGNDLATVEKYGEVLFLCEIMMDRIFYSEIGAEITALKKNLIEDEHQRPGDFLKQHFIENHFNGVNIPANSLLNEQRKLVIYKPELIRILGWQSVDKAVGEGLSEFRNGGEMKYNDQK